MRRPSGTLHTYKRRVGVPDISWCCSAPAVSARSPGASSGRGDQVKRVGKREQTARHSHQACLSARHDVLKACAWKDAGAGTLEYCCLRLHSVLRTHCVPHAVGPPWLIWCRLPGHAAATIYIECTSVCMPAALHAPVARPLPCAPTPCPHLCLCLGGGYHHTQRHPFYCPCLTPSLC